MTPENPGTLTIVVEDAGMDSGCIQDILQTCLNHGKVLKVRTEGPHIDGGRYDNDLMFMLEGMEPEQGKC